MNSPQEERGLVRSKDLILEVVEILSEQEDLEATIIGCGKASLMTGIFAFIGGLLGGPFGIFVGGSAGAASAALYSRGNVRSVVSIIREDLNAEQKNRLANAVGNIINSITAEDAVTIVMLLAGQDKVKAMVLEEIGNFLKREMNMGLANL
ncbi:protein C19orf12 homolog [Aethina tumida]|uniref:protein C19orf12 homolog n=1 Tax=Aethina tumida TaxID=116153 RepID=UPI00096B4B0D|nr:protein C19orf12 homolog [Aethina tumida]